MTHTARPKCGRSSPLDHPDVDNRTALRLKQRLAEQFRDQFEDRWTDRYCIEVTRDLIEIIGQSWARQELIPPYHVYLKMAYHLSHEARAGLAEFRIPRDFGDRLFEFQTAAVKIAAHHLNKRGGVLIGDVAGLGKTLMATAVARIFEDDYGLETLILCPKNLVRTGCGRRFSPTLGATARASPSRSWKSSPPHSAGRKTRRGLVTTAITNSSLPGSGTSSLKKSASAASWAGDAGTARPGAPRGPR